MSQVDIGCRTRPFPPCFKSQLQPTCDGSDQGPTLATTGGSLGSHRQQLLPRWAPAAGNQPLRLRPAYTPTIPEPLPQLNSGAPGPGFAGLPGGPYALDALFDDPQ